MCESRSWPISSPLTYAVQSRSRKPSASWKALELVGGDDPRADRGGEVLALGGAEADLHLAGLEVAGRPVVDDRVAEDRLARLGLGERRAAAAEDDADLHLEVEGVAERGLRDRLAGAVERVRVGEVERRVVVPRVRDADRVVDAPAHPLDVALEGDEVADAGRLVGQLQQPDVQRDPRTRERPGRRSRARAPGRGRRGRRRRGRPGDGKADVPVDDHADGGSVVAERGELHAGGRVASAMPLWDTCAVRPPSMTISAPL